MFTIYNKLINNKFNKYIFLLVIVVSAIFIFYFWHTFADDLISRYGRPRDAGGYGDIHGYINSLFSGLALIFVIAALLFQIYQIDMIRRQLSNDTFFRLVDMHNRNMSSITWDNKQGRDAFVSLYYNLVSRLNDTESKERTNSDVKSIYNKYWSIHESLLTVYYQNIILILKFIHEADISTSKRLFYNEVLRSQFTNHERILLTCHCISETMEGFRDMVKKCPDLCLCDGNVCEGPIKLQKKQP